MTLIKFNEESLHSDFILNEDLSGTPIYTLPEVLDKLELGYPDFVGMANYKLASVVSWDDTKKTAIVEDYKPRASTYPTVREAYEAYKDIGVLFHPSVKDSNEFDLELIYNDSETNVLYGEYVFLEDNERAFLGFTDNRNFEELYREYYLWLCTARRWVSHKDDFFNSWNFLNSHPALWRKLKESKGNHYTRPITHPALTDSNGMTPNDWQRTNLVQGIVSKLECSGERKIFLKMSVGNSLANLSCTVETYEEGVVLLAEMVHQDFKVNGARRIDW